MSRRLAAVAALASLMLGLGAGVAAPAHAAWPAEGKVVNDVSLIYGPSPWYGSGPCELLDGPDGSLFVKSAPASPSSFYWTIGRLASNGDSIPGWPTEGRRVIGTLAGYNDCYHESVVSPAAELLFACVAEISTPRVTRLDATGTRLPEAYPNYWVAGTTSAYNASAASGPFGDMYVSWGQKLLRLKPDGTVAAGWPAAGLVATTNSYRSAVIADDAGGVLVLGTTPGNRPLVTRVDSNAVRHTGWPVGGRALCTPAVVSMDYYGIRHPLVRTDATHAMALWSETTSNGHLRLQRISFDGTLDPNWSPDGLLLDQLDTLTSVTMVPDGQGGAWIGYEWRFTPVLVHVFADGSMISFEPLDAAARYSKQTFRGYTPINAIAMDRAPDGGVFFAWSDLRQPGYEQVRWRRFTAMGAPHPAEPDTGRIVWTRENYPNGSYVGRTRAIHSDGEGGVYVLRDLGCPMALHHEVPYARLGVTPPAPRAGLELRAPAPNPARDAITLRFTLPDARPATLTLFDVAGRAMRTSQSSGAGEHTVRWDDAGALSPGLYLAQLRQGTETRTARVVVTR